MKTLLKASNLGLCAAGDDWLFKNVNLEINSGEIIIICGNIGSGKTLFTDVLCGLKKPNRGIIERNVPLTVVTQEFTLYKDLTVLENLEFIRAINDNASTKTADILKITGLAGWKTVKAAKLPAGMKKMLQIACALIRKTPLIILDEPTGGLDQDLNAKFRILLDKLAGEGCGIIIMTNQIMKEISPDRIFGIDKNGLSEISKIDAEKDSSPDNKSRVVS